MTPSPTGDRRRPPVDPRLMRRGLPVRRFIASAVAIGVASTAVVVAQAVLLGGVVARVVLSRDIGPSVTLAAVLVVCLTGARAILVWTGEMVAHRTAAGVKSALRGELLAAVLTRAPGNRLGRPAGELAAVAVRGLDSLDSYFGRFLPDLVLAAVAPVGILCWMATFDLLSALSLALVAALVPVFGVLLGLAARSRAESHWRELAGFAGHFLDVVNGLPTLRALNRAAAQVGGVAAAGESLRKRTMATLRVAFLSALALEVLAAVGTALVAVGVGLRLLDGHASLAPSLAVLVVAPEVFLPLRRASAQFHASAEGLAAIETVFDVIAPSSGDQPRAAEDAGPPSGDGREVIPRVGTVSIALDRLTVLLPGRPRPVLCGVDLHVAAGEHVMLQGASGAGKTTLIGVVLGFTPADGGRVSVNGVDLAEGDVQAVRRTIAWVPQRAHLFSGTVAENIALGRPGATTDEIEEAAEAAGAFRFIESLPRGFDTVIGENGMTLSGGERQRLALARALVRRAPIVVLDEPTSALDRGTEQAVVAAVMAHTSRSTLLVASHRPAWARAVDRLVNLHDGRLAAVAALVREAV